MSVCPRDRPRFGPCLWSLWWWTWSLGQEAIGFKQRWDVENASMFWVIEARYQSWSRQLSIWLGLCTREKDDVRGSYRKPIHILMISHAKWHFEIRCTRNELGFVNAKVRLVRREVCWLICDSHPVQIFLVSSSHWHVLLIPLLYTVFTWKTLHWRDTFLVLWQVLFEDPITGAETVSWQGIMECAQV